MKQKISDIVIRNTTYNIIGRFWQTLVAIFLTPYVIHRIGTDRYGLLAIIGAFTSYAGLFDAGVNSSFARFMAEYHADKKVEKITEVIKVGFLFYSAFGLIIATAAILFLNPMLGLFNIPAGLYQEAHIVFILGIALFVISSVFYVFSSVQVGLQRMDFSNKILIGASVINIIGTIFALQKGYGLIGLMIINLFVTGMISLANVIVARVLLPSGAHKNARIDITVFYRLLSFGWRSQLGRIAGIVTTQTDKILIAFFLSIGLVTPYQLGFNVILYVFSLTGLFVSALFPAFTQLSVQEGSAALINAYIKSAKYAAFIIVPAFIFTAISAPTIMTFWMGQPNSQATAVIRILSLGWMINALGQIGASLSIAVNKPQIMARGAGIAAVLNIVISIVLIKYFGFFGAAWGGSIAAATGVTYFFIELHRTLKVKPGSFIAVTVPCILIGLVAAIPTLFCVDFMLANKLGADRLTQFALLSIEGMIFAAIYLILAYLFRIFTVSDFDYFKNTIFSMRI